MSVLFPLLLLLHSVVLGVGFCKGILRYEIKQESVNSPATWISSEEHTTAPSTANSSRLTQPSEIGYFNPFSRYNALASPVVTAQD